METSTRATLVRKSMRKATLTVAQSKLLNSLLVGAQELRRCRQKNIWLDCDRMEWRIAQALVEKGLIETRRLVKSADFQARPL